MGIELYRKRQDLRRNEQAMASIGPSMATFNIAATQAYFERFWPDADGRVYYVLAYYDTDSGKILLRPTENEVDGSLCVNWSKRKHVAITFIGFVKRFGIQVTPGMKYTVEIADLVRYFKDDKDRADRVIVLTPQRAAGDLSASATKPVAAVASSPDAARVIPPDIDETQNRPKRGRRKAGHPGYRCAACKHTHVGWKYGVYKAMGMHPRECPKCGGTNFELNPEL